MLTLRGAGYRYPSSSEPAALDVELTVEPGEVVLLTGPTGCGKSTVLRLAAGLAGRHGSGTVSGRIEVDGRDPATVPPAERVGLVGFVAQNPSRQVITGTLADEIAFGLESAGWAADRIATRAPQVLREVGLDRYPPRRSTAALSGGERQRLVVGAALAAGARLLLLDEPLAHLDPGGARRLIELLRRVADTGVGVLIVEHRLEPVLPPADRLAGMEAGTVVDVSGGSTPSSTEEEVSEVWPDRQPDEVDADQTLPYIAPASEPDLPLLRRLGLRIPGLLDVADRLGALWPPTGPIVPPPSPPKTPSDGAPRLEARSLSWSWPGTTELALKGVSVAVHAGETVAVLGSNGGGKSTLLAGLVGALKSKATTRRGRAVRIPQDPDLALFCRTVREELEYGPGEARLRAEAARAEADAAARALSLEGLEDRPPQALSRGQRLRTAVAAALACRPDVLVLDEPTSGQDHDQVERMMCALTEAEDGRAVLFATHDVDLALRHADRVWVLEGGRVVLDAGPVEAAAHLAEGGTLPLPPLAAWCRAHGLPALDPADLAAAVRGGN